MQRLALTTDEILDRLRDRGYRLTAPRRLIVETIREFDRSFTADGLLQRVEAVDPTIGRATVFRTLDVLAGMSILDRVHAPDGCHSYILCEGVSRHHHHLICSSCGTVVPFEACNVEALFPTLSSRNNFQISGHMLEVFGLCGACQN